MIPSETSRLVLLLIPCSLLPSAGCASIMANMSRATTIEERSFPVAGQGRPSLVAETFNGAIRVAGNSKGEIKAKVTRVGTGRDQTAAEADIANVRVDYATEGDTIRIVASRIGRRTFGSSGAEIELQVPADTALVLTSRNGEIETHGVHASIAAHTSNGQVALRGARGKIDAGTSNGKIDVEATDAVVSARSSNGDVRFVGSLAAGGHILETSNGGITLAVPESARFHVSARTSNGTVASRLGGLQVESGKPGTNRLAGRLVGTAASGGTPVSTSTSPAAEAVDVTLETSNGGITLEPVPQAESPRAQ